MTDEQMWKSVSSSRKINRIGPINKISGDYSKQRMARGCESKVTHVNKESADKEAERFYKKRGYAFTSYKCRFCGFFHIAKVWGKNEN